MIRIYDDKNQMIGKIDQEDFCTVVLGELPAGRYGDIEDYYHPGGFAEVSDAQVIEIMAKPVAPAIYCS